MQAPRPLTSGAADAVSTGSSYGRGSLPPVTRATVTSDMVAFPETDVGTWIYDQRLPTNDIPTINHTTKDETIDEKINFTFNKSQKRDVTYAMSNTFGFGGHNACVLFKKFEE